MEYGRRCSDPSDAVSIVARQQMRRDKVSRTATGIQHRSLLPTVDLCATCQNLFDRPNEPADQAFQTTLLRGLYTGVRVECRICNVLKHPGRYSDAPAVGEQLQIAPGSSGSLNLYLRSHFDHIYVGGHVVMEFLKSVPNSSEPRAESSRKDLDYRKWRSDPLVPVLRSATTNDETCFQQIQDWLKICTSQHTMCQQAMRDGQDSYLPTRLIDIHDEPRLVITTSEAFKSHGVRYATLSHRWRKGTAAKLLRSNISGFLQRIDRSCLTPVFRDAISAVRRLGLDYIWIDALCIIQNDPEDWTKEASSMNMVYKHAYCNLGASAAGGTEAGDTSMAQVDARGCAEDTSIGMFTSRSLDKYSMVHLPITRRKCNEAFYGFHRDLRPNLAADNLMGRGWIFQERLLSPRSIYFGKQLTWECSELLANESFPEGLKKSATWASRWVDELPQRVPNMLHKGSQEYSTYLNDVRINEVYRTWLALVAKYSACELTYRSDSLPAVSGLAKSFQAELQDEYLAGIWRKDMIRGLLWRTWDWQKKDTPQSSIYYGTLCHLVPHICILISHACSTIVVLGFSGYGCRLFDGA